MLFRLFLALGLLASIAARSAGDTFPAPQAFHQEIATSFGPQTGLATLNIQLLDLAEGAPFRAFADGRWYELQGDRWAPSAGLQCPSADRFLCADGSRPPVEVSVPWRSVRQVLRRGPRMWIAAQTDVYQVAGGRAESMHWPAARLVNRIAVGGGGEVYAASSDGLFRQAAGSWSRVQAMDGVGRSWLEGQVLGVAFDVSNRLWFATLAGVGLRTVDGWRFFEGKDGLPWNEFTAMASGPAGEMWFGTRLGAIRFDGQTWAYRQGPRWLPDDAVRDLVVDSVGTAWFATSNGVGRLAREPMTLARKALFYEDEIARYIKRTPFGYVAEAPLRRTADKSSADPQDSDNDGLWTAMYGAGECFAYAATGDPVARERAVQAFNALRFLQEVTQGGAHSPPPGYVARTIRPMDWPDPNVGRIEGDREAQRGDSLWKVYEPRWPKSADGKWYWKSDTSSDELDGHFFLYGLFSELVARTDEERQSVRRVVAALTDHLLQHHYCLIDHDGQPTRWAVYDPARLNADPRWWPERGLNSLSMLSYLAVAARMTGDPKYRAASRDLIERHGYAQNAMYPKAQLGPGSGNQSDDEMAFMCYYNLLRYSDDEALKTQIGYSFFQYWAGEAPEMNPFFNFAYAGLNLQAQGASPFGRFSLRPWDGWLDDAMATLRGFPLDRLDWPLRNSHRLDVVRLERHQSGDLYELDHAARGRRVDGKVIPVENRHFNHWNTDPWRLDYGGRGEELAAGTVFLLPYYMGLYHGFIAKP